MGVAACLTAAPGAKNDFEVETFVVQSVAGNISHTLGTSTGNSEDGTGRGVPIITSCARKALAFAQNSRGELRLESGHGQIAGALSTGGGRSEEHTSELQSLMRISYAVFCLNKKR